MKKTILKLAVIAALWLLLAVGLAVLKTTFDNHHYAIASSPRIEGKFVDSMCMPYAIALSKELAAEGIHGRLIFYNWQMLDSQQSNSHVFVRYVSNNGDVWIVDNEIEHPIKVPADTSDMDLIYILGGTTAADAAQHVRIELNDSWRKFSYF